jgi:hypothetical protein
MKRLRKHLEPKTIRYYHCGEYGDKLGRPHYHAVIFGHDFNDKELVRQKGDQKYYESKTLTKIWGKGKTEVMDVTPRTTAYAARYIMKKITGDLAETHYEKLIEDTGEIIQVEPEYSTMSRKPGIGRKWIEKYTSDVYPWDEVIIDGKRVQPPKYYDTYFESINPEEMQRIKVERAKYAYEHKEDQTPERLATREICKVAQTKNLKRNLK